MPRTDTDTCAQPPFVFDDGAAYEHMMGRWSTQVAQPFLAWLALPPGLAWVDVGCGDGSLTQALMQHQRPASVVGVDPAPAQLSHARQRVTADGVCFVAGDAQALPLPDGSVDAAVMALVLFFLPDPALGVHELARVLRAGGTAAAYQWDLDGGGLPLQPIVDAVEAEGHTTQRPPSAWTASCGALDTLWQHAGLVDVQTCAFTVNRRFDSFDDYWRTAQGSPRLRALLATLEAPALQRVRSHVRCRLGVVHDGPLVATARAHAVQGRKP